MKIKILLFLVIGAVSFISYCFFPIIFYSQDSQPGRVFVTDRNGQVIIDKPKPNGYKIDTGIDLDSDFVKNLVEIEDKNFYSHLGVDFISKMGAIRANFASGKIVSGGSTITEQMIKNKYFLEASRSYIQKAREAFLAVSFSLYYSKDEILEQYLQNIYLGKNNYGVPAAMQTYFQKDSTYALTPQEQVILIGLVKFPGIDTIDQKYFSQYCEKIKNKLGFDYQDYQYILHPKKSIDILPWGQNYPTIDAQLQSYAKDIINTTLDELADKNVTNAAVYAINPKNGEVLLYQASRDFYSKVTDGEVDIILSKRQMGSTLKPFAYLLALEKGAQGDNFLVDIDTQYESFQENKTYISSNYNGKNYGLIRLKKALGNSLNNASVRLIQDLGLHQSFAWYETFGFDFDYSAQHYGYSFVLGSPSISLKSLVENYAKLLPSNSEIASQESKFLLYDILSNPDNRDISFGVNSILNTSVKMAVKTGTSSNFKDNVVVSYHPDLVIGVWVGNNDNSAMKGVTGITGAGYIWHQIAEKAIEMGYIKYQKIPVPEHIAQKNYCLDTYCFRKENIYVNSLHNSDFSSAIGNNMYDFGDIFIDISQNEENILHDMGF